MQNNFTILVITKCKSGRTVLSIRWKMATRRRFDNDFMFSDGRIPYDEAIEFIAQ